MNPETREWLRRVVATDHDRAVADHRTHVICRTPVIWAILCAACGNVSTTTTEATANARAAWHTKRFGESVETR